MGDLGCLVFFFFCFGLEVSFLEGGWFWDFFCFGFFGVFFGLILFGFFFLVYPLFITLLVSACEWLSVGLPALESNNLITLPVLHPYGSGHSFSHDLKRKQY